MKGPDSEAVRELTGVIHSLPAQVELLTEQNKGLQEFCTHKKKPSKKSKSLSLQQRKEYHSGPVFWSPGRSERHAIVG
jgi:hypothetical protein